MNGSSPRDTRTAGMSDAGSAPSKAKLWSYCKADHWAAIVIDSPGFSIWGNDAVEIYICEQQSSTHVVCSTDCSLLKSSLSCFSTTGNKKHKTRPSRVSNPQNYFIKADNNLEHSSLPAISEIKEIELGIFPFFLFISSLKTWTRVPDTKQLS